MAYSENFPAQRPIFSLDASNAGRLDPRCSFSRASTGTFFGTEKVLSSENILLQSQNLDTTWAAVDIAAPSGSQTAPDGTSTAWLLTAQTGSSKAPYVRQSPTFSGSTQYTMVGHLKAGTASHGYISFRTQNGYSAYALLDFSGGTVSHAGFGDFTGVTSSVTALGSSWFKVTLTATTGSNLSSSNVAVGISDGTTPTSAGYAVWSASGETMYSWGIQLASTNAKTYDSPTTTQIARNYQTKLQTAASGAARFEHSATDGQSAGTSLGILVEGQSTNLVTYSEDLSNGAWTKVRSSITPAAAIAPDGTLTANQLTVDGTALNSHYLFYDYTTGGATAQTVSFFVKAGTLSWLQIRFSNNNGAFSDSWANYNLSTGAIGTISGGVTASATSCGNGWYRVVATQTALTNATGRIRVYAQQADNTIDFDGNSYDHLLIWGGQIEANASHASSLISTSGSTVTRAAESLSVATADIGYTGGDVSLVFEGDFIGDSSGTPHLFSLRTSSSDRIEAFRNPSDDKLKVSAKADDVLIASATASASGIAANTKFKFGVSYGDNCNSSTDSDAGMTEITGVVAPSSLSHLYVGYTGSGSHLDGHCAKIALYSSEISKTNLQAITS